MAIPHELRTQIEERDRKCCRYCFSSENNCGLRMHVDHIIPESAGGTTAFDNLCLACFSCNVCKGAKQEWKDPITGEAVLLFHPIRENWDEHFAWDESRTRITGRTPCGRATIEALKMNNPTVVNARRRWVSAGWHPPATE